MRWRGILARMATPHLTVSAEERTRLARTRLGELVLGKWRLDRLLGVGGMACVYAATHRNKKRAAVKMLHREYSSDSAIRERSLPTKTQARPSLVGITPALTPGVN